MLSHDTLPALQVPGDAGYAAAGPWNLSIPSRPRAVVAARTADDVAAAVRVAADRGLRVAVRSTGHGAVPVDDDVLLIATGALTECTVHAADRWARVGAGVLWQQVVEQAAPYGLAPICGSSPLVGVVGLLSGGGVGPLARAYGVSSDLVRALDVVTGTGRRLRVTSTEHPDLFWGLRGGKATLGIVTAVELDLPELAEFYGGALWFAAEDAGPVLHAWRRLCQELPERATTSAAVMRLPDLPVLPPAIAGKQTLAIRFASVGDGAAVLDGLRRTATPVLDDVHTRPYVEIGRVHSDPVPPAPVHDHSALLGALPDDAVDRLLAAVDPGSNVQSIVELRHLGGAISREPAHPSAVCHRDAAFQLFLSGRQAPGLDTDTQASRILAALAPWLTGGLLPNFAASDDPRQISRYYDPETLDRLAALGDRYDPRGVLRVGQVARTTAR